MTNPPTTAAIRAAALAYFTDEANVSRTGARAGFPLWISTYVAKQTDVPLVGHGHASDSFHKRVCKVLRTMKDDGVLVSSGNAQNTQYSIAPTPEEVAESAARAAAYEARIARSADVALRLRQLGYEDVTMDRTRVVLDVDLAEQLLALLLKETR